MTNADKLKNLLELELIPDLEAAIDELFSTIDKAKMASIAQKEDLEEMREMRTECFAIVEERVLLLFFCFHIYKFSKKLIYFF